ncbi:MAG: hypothetical protein K5838_06110 [Elusimicrobiales bacterium]|nr:hypothetical protein [Elusimicrobiales bacterium]
MYNYYMRRILILIAIIFSMTAIGYSKTVKQRVGNLEKRVSKTEKRISALEKKSKASNKNAQAAAKKTAENTKNPIITYFISAENKSNANKMGVILTLVVENSISKPIYAFSGTFVFKDSQGQAFFSYPYVQSDALYGYKRSRVLIPVDSAKNTKAYLRFVKDKKIKAYLVNQKIYY